MSHWAKIVYGGILFLLAGMGQSTLMGHHFPLFSERPAAAIEPMGNGEWLALLANEGPWLLVVRHGRTGGAPYGGLSKEELQIRAGERILSHEGWKQARAAGEFLAKAEIEVSGVYASPLYRARDTAQLLFGDFEVWEPLQSADAGLRRREEMLNRMDSILAEGRREVWVTHSPNVADMLGFWAVEGQMYLLQWEDGEIFLAGTWRIDLAPKD